MPGLPVPTSRSTSDRGHLFSPIRSYMSSFSQSYFDKAQTVTVLPLPILHPPHVESFQNGQFEFTISSPPQSFQ
jgi:hypothetical protein